MRGTARWVVVVVLLTHGFIQLLGAAKGLGLSDVPQLTQPIGPTLGWAWLAAGLLVTVTAVLLVLGIRWWWVIGAVCVVFSQTVIFTSWGDAKAGTVANVVLILAVGYGFASQGPTGYRAEYRHRVNSALTLVTEDSSSTGVITDADLASLPEPVARYVRWSGAVGKEQITSFRALIHGRIRSATDGPWMCFTGEQTNTFGSEPSRLFFMDATMHGLPVDVLHAYVGPTATMRVKLASLVHMVNASGPEMDQGETVTLFNDMCLMAPAVLVDARIRWQPIDAHHAQGYFTNGDQTVSAELVFDDDGQLIDFVSDDRFRATADGVSFTPQRWSTPDLRYRSSNDRRVLVYGEGRWHAPPSENDFTYLEFNVDNLDYNVHT
jgi:Family of unknown function (DUF6544)